MKKMIDNKEEDNKIFYKIRISNPTSDSEGKIRHLINGISANSWLTPIGISQRTDKIPYGPITEEIRTVILERAQSAGSVLGRRHFEIEKQEVKKDEILRGKPFKFKSEERKESEKIVHGGRFCGRKCQSTYAEYRSKLLSNRPHTSYIPQRTHTPDMESLNVHVEPLCVNKNKEIDKISECKTSQNSEENTEKSPFKSLSEMKIAYRDRIKSAPALLTKPIPQNMPLHQEKDRAKSVPVYWKARTVYHRRQMADCGGEEFEDNFVYFTKGSLLRPLMHSEATALKHSAGCPYKCKGCFRACLVSQDYYDKVKQRKKEKPKQRIIRPNFYHRRILELALAKLQPINNMMKNDMNLTSVKEQDKKVKLKQSENDTEENSKTES